MTINIKNIKELYEEAKDTHRVYYTDQLQLRVQSEQIDKENKKNKVNGPIEIFEDFISYAEKKSSKESTLNKDNNSYYFRMRLTPYELVLIIDLLCKEHESKDSCSLKKELTIKVLKKMHKHLKRFRWSRNCAVIDKPILEHLSIDIDAVLNNVYPQCEKHYLGYSLPLGTTIETYKKFLKNFDTLENFKEFLDQRTKEFLIKNADLINFSKQ